MISKRHDEIFIWIYSCKAKIPTTFFFKNTSSPNSKALAGSWRLTPLDHFCHGCKYSSWWPPVKVNPHSPELKMVKQKALMEGWARAQGMVCTNLTQFINFLQTVLVSSSTGNYHQRFTRKKTRDIRMEPLFSLSPIFPPQKQSVGSPR